MRIAKMIARWFVSPQLATSIDAEDNLLIALRYARRENAERETEEPPLAA